MLWGRGGVYMHLVCNVLLSNIHLFNLITIRFADASTELNYKCFFTDT